MSFRWPFFQGTFSAAEQKQMKVIHYLYKTILKKNPQATDCVLAMSKKGTYKQPQVNPDQAIDFDGAAEIRKLRRHGNLREIIITILPKISEWQVVRTKGLLTGYANEPVNLFLEEFKIWFRSLAEKLSLDQVLHEEVLTRAEYLTALQQKEEFAAIADKLQALEAKVDAITAEIARSIARSTLHDRLKKARNLVRCLKSDLTSYLYYVIRSTKTDQMFDLEDLVHKEHCDDAESMLKEALGLNVAGDGTNRQEGSGRGPRSPRGGASSPMLLEGPDSRGRSHNNNNNRRAGRGSSRKGSRKRGKGSRKKGASRGNSRKKGDRRRKEEEGGGQLVVAGQGEGVVTVVDDEDQDNLEKKNPFFNEEGESVVPPNCQLILTPSGRTGIYEPLRKRVFDCYLKLHGLLRQVGEFALVLDSALDLALLGDVVVYALANKLFVEIIDRGTRLLGEVSSSMTEMKQTLSSTLKRAVAKRIKLNKRWDANRLKSLPFSARVKEQIESALKEMSDVMQTVKAVRLEDVAAVAKSKTEALVRIGASFCNATASICHLPRSQSAFDPAIHLLQQAKKEKEENRIKMLSHGHIEVVDDDEDDFHVDGETGLAIDPNTGLVNDAPVVSSTLLLAEPIDENDPNLTMGERMLLKQLNIVNLELSQERGLKTSEEVAEMDEEAMLKQQKLLEELQWREETKEFRQDLEMFYKEHDPEVLDTEFIDSTVRIFHGREQHCFSLLRKRYVDLPTQSTHSAKELRAIRDREADEANSDSDMLLLLGPDGADESPDDLESADSLEDSEQDEDSEDELEPEDEIDDEDDDDEDGDDLDELLEDDDSGDESPDSLAEVSADSLDAFDEDI